MNKEILCIVGQWEMIGTVSLDGKHKLKKPPMKIYEVIAKESDTIKLIPACLLSK